MFTLQRRPINSSQHPNRKRSTALAWTCVWVWVSWMWMGVLAGCPKMCECFWRASRLTATCREADLIDIPRGLEPKTKVLDLSNNNLRILPRDAFIYTGLTTLQKVVLSHCKLSLMEAGCFNSVQNIMELDLSYNQLRHVPSSAVKGLVLLRELNLAHNALTTLSATAFIYTPHIVQLDLSQNSITSAATGALRILTELEILNLADNRLSYFNASELYPLSLLRFIRVDGNPWRCSCHLRPLQKWFHDNNIVASIPPSCSYPKWLSGRDWQGLAREDLLCAPQVSSIAPRVLVSRGENVSLLCRIETEVETIITWFVGDLPLFNDDDFSRYLVVDFESANNSSFVSNLTITSVNMEDQGTYRCVAENRAGVRETNFTLQVSHEVAEVRVATVHVSYMKESLLGGVSALILVLVLIVVYCKVRMGRQPQRNEENVDTAQSSRGSKCDVQHKLGGYQVIPTNDMDESSPRLQPNDNKDSTWHAREGGTEARQVLLTEEVTDDPRHTAVPFLNGAPGDSYRIQEAAKLLLRHDEVFPHLVCSRSMSQISFANTNYYPDLLDLPPTQLQHRFSLHKEGQLLHDISSASCVRKRTYSDAGYLAGVGLDGAMGEPSHPMSSHTPYTPTKDQQDSSRSSSALNLALSQAASNAYINVHLAATAVGAAPAGRRCLGTACQLQHPGISSVEGSAGGPGQARSSSSGGGGGGQLESSGDEWRNSANPCHFEYHAAQLEKFIKEYRCLQEQLNHMKQSYEAHKRAGSIPRLDCCSQDDSGHKSSRESFGDGSLACSCRHDSTQPYHTDLRGEPTSIPCYPETSSTPFQTSERCPDMATTQPQVLVIPGESEHISAGSYAEGFKLESSIPERGYVDSKNNTDFSVYLQSKNTPSSRYTDASHAVSEGQMSSSVTSSPTHYSPKTKTSSKGDSTEPLKSILKKSTDRTGGRQSVDQWTRSSSSPSYNKTVKPLCQSPPEDPNMYSANDMHPSSVPHHTEPSNLQNKAGHLYSKVVDHLGAVPATAHTHFKS